MKKFYYYLFLIWLILRIKKTLKHIVTDYNIKISENTFFKFYLFILIMTILCGILCGDLLFEQKIFKMLKSFKKKK